jgi:hypothetical protein
MQKLFGEYLVEEKLITRDELYKALGIQMATRHGKRFPLIGTVSVGMGAITSGNLDTTLQEQQRDRPSWAA